MTSGGAKILVGTSSWTDKTLIESGKFYPPTATTPEDRLRFYASQFPIVEIDSSYYGIPTVENARRWVERTPPGFVFNIKTYRLFTRHQTPVVSLSRRTFARRSAPSRRKTSTTRIVPPEVTQALWRQFRACSRCCGTAASSAPCTCNSRLGWRSIPRRFDYLIIAGRCWRDSPWPWSSAIQRGSTPKSTYARTLAFERENGLVNVVVDEPQGHREHDSIRVGGRPTPNLAVVRLHGRNHGTWNRKGLKASSQRFDYDYSNDELEGFAEDMKPLAPRAKTVHVLFNNNYQDQGQRGARALASLL